MSDLVKNFWTCLVLMMSGIGILYVTQLTGLLGMIGPTPPGY